MGLNIVGINVFNSLFTNCFLFCHPFTFFNVFYIVFELFYIYDLTHIAAKKSQARILYIKAIQRNLKSMLNHSLE